MKKNSLLVMFLIMTITLMLIAPTCSQAVKTQKHTATFHCNASGKCIVVTKFSPPGQSGDQYVPSKWTYGEGKGTFAGAGKVDQQPPNAMIPVRWYYRNSGIHTGGSLSASWGEQQTIRLELFSNGAAGGFFVDESPLTDTFVAGFGPGAGFVSYKGTYRDSTGTYKIHGNATIQAAIQISTSMIQASIYKPDNTPLFWIIWSETDIPSPINLDAADVFVRSVKITTSH